MMEFQRKQDEDELILRDSEKKEQEEWPPALLVAAAYHPKAPDDFVVAAEGPYAGYFYECEFASPRPLRAVPTSAEPAVSFTFSKNFWISAHRDGSYQMRSLAHPKLHLKVQSHDAFTSLKKVVLNQSETIAVSVADDSTLFVNKLAPEGLLEAARTQKNPKAPESFPVESGLSGLRLGQRPSSLQLQTEDLTDPSVYSIQLDKLQTDEDKKKSLAEMKKQRKRQEIAALRNEFAELSRENANFEEKFRLTEEELNLDPEYSRTLFARNEQLQEEVRRETAWRAEYYRIWVGKYKKYFLNNVALERFRVNALLSTDYVNSFRVAKPSQFLLDNLRSIQHLIDEEGARGHTQSLLSDSDSAASPAKHSLTQEQSEYPEETKTDFRIPAQPKGEQKKKSKAQEERERRTQLREERKEKIERKKRNEPSKSYNPSDQRNIDLALTTMGDFKLKTSPDYVVPKSLCVNASQKRRQMFLLIESTFNLKMELNAQLLALRDTKTKLLDWIKAQNARVKEINKELGISEQLFEGTSHKEEWPEHYYTITEKDIEYYVKVNELFAPEEESVAEERPRPQSSRRPQALSASEEQFNAHREVKLLNEKTQVLGEVSQRIKSFDESLRLQQQEKLILEGDLKQIDMKLITYYLELNLLEELEPDDQRLTASIEKLNQEKATLLQEIADINKQYEQHQREQEEITRERNDIYVQFNVKVEASAFAKELQTIFEKNIKRSKRKKAAEEREEEGEEPEDEEEDSESSFDDEDEDGGNDFDLCPPECDNLLFEDVCQLRELRLDLVDKSNSKKQTINELKKRQEEIEKNERKLSRSIDRAELEIQEFERDKMQKLNQLDVSLVLMQDQVQVIQEDRALPHELAHSVLFTNNELQKLRHRTVELQQEKDNELARKQELDSEMRRLERKCKVREKKKEEAKTKYEAIQALRFGHAIKLENLKYAEPNDELAKRKTEFVKAEKTAIRVEDEAKARLGVGKELLRQVTRRNTLLLERRAKLFERIMKVNKLLDLGNREIFREEEDDDLEDNFQQQEHRMNELIDLHRRKIAELKTEINLFRRKGGHIYTKITANRRANLG